MTIFLLFFVVFSCPTSQTPSLVSHIPETLSSLSILKYYGACNPPLFLTATTFQHFLASTSRLASNLFEGWDAGKFLVWEDFCASNRFRLSRPFTLYLFIFPFAWPLFVIDASCTVSDGKRNNTHCLYLHEMFHTGRHPRWLGRLSSCLLKSISRGVQFSPSAHTVLVGTFSCIKID